MGKFVAIAGRLGERAPELIVTTWAAPTRVNLLFGRIFNVVPAADAPAGAASQRRAGMPAGRPPSLGSDTVDARHVNPVMLPVGCQPPKSVDVNEACKQGESLGPADGDGTGPRYEMDYRLGRVGARSMRAIRDQYQERLGEAK
jgi:hypothetical protein